MHRWAEQNVNPALFPRELMANASDLVMDEEVFTIPIVYLYNCTSMTDSHIAFWSLYSV